MGPRHEWGLTQMVLGCVYLDDGSPFSTSHKGPVLFIRDEPCTLGWRLALGPFPRGWGATVRTANLTWHIMSSDSPGGDPQVCGVA